MEFLHSRPIDGNMVTLLLAVARNDRVELMRYEWDCTRPLYHIQSAPTGTPVPEELGTPLFIIPVTVFTGFILVCEQWMVTYPDVSSLWETFHTDKLYPEHEDYQFANDAGASRDRPRWTYWARPVRRSDWLPKNDIVYLSRSDGLVRSVMLNDEGKHINPNIHGGSGNLNLNIDTAFAVLDSSRKEYDLDDEEGSYDTLITAGSQSEGAVLLFKPKTSGIPQQYIPNWSHIVDFAMIPRPRDPNDGRRPYGRDRIFACAGSGLKHGAICEMRLGVAAQTIARSKLEDMIPSRLWLLPDHSSKGVCMLISTLGQSRAYSLPRPGQEIDVDISELKPHTSSLAAITQNDADTVAAAETKDGILIQVTTKSIRAILGSAPRNDEQQMFCRDLGNLRINRITKASIESGTSMLLITARRMSEDILCFSQFVHGEHGQIELGDDLMSSNRRLPAEPSCISLQIVSKRHIAFVGLCNRTVRVYFVGESGMQLSEEPYEHTFEGDNAICESILVIRRDSDEHLPEKYMVLCGLRNGTLQILQVTITEGSG